MGESMSKYQDMEVDFEEEDFFMVNYLREFKDIEDHTIEVLRQQGFDSKNKLLMMDLDRDLNDLPLKNLAQRCVLRFALNKLKEENARLTRDLRENNAQKEDQEERISTLEKRYLNAQRESTSLHDLNEKLEHELANKEAQLTLAEDKIRALAERLELSEQKIAQFTRKQESIADGNQEAVFDEIDEEHKLSLEERISRLEQQLEEKSGELNRARQREKMNEEHNQRLSATVDKLLAESNERLQLHLKERMSALEEKNTMNGELERTRKLLEETQLYLP